MKSSKNFIAAAAIIATLSFAGGVSAQAMDPGMKMGTPTATDMSDGEVRKIDKENKKITLAHGAIRNLDMPGMTMVFQVQDTALLDKVQVGSKVRFKAERVGGAFVVTALESVM